MIKAELFTWIIFFFGIITFLPLLGAQLVILINPTGRKAKDLLIGKGEDWRDHTHFRSAYAFAWADWLFILPIFLCGNIGALSGRLWGYIAWIIVGGVSIYFSIVFWVLEKEYTYPSCGALAYYTYYWGFFLYWGLAAVGYSVFRIIEFTA